MSTTIIEAFSVQNDLLPESQGAETEAGSIDLTPRPSDPSRAQWMRLVETSPGLSFWHSQEENIYTETDGEPLCEP